MVMPCKANFATVGCALVNDTDVMPKITNLRFPR